MALAQSLASLSLATSAEDENAIPTKTLIFKPKTAKTATPIPILVFALQSTNTSSSIIAKSANVKEPRLAKNDLVEEFFKVSTKDVSIANLNKNLAGKIKILLDENVLKSATKDEVLKLSTETSSVCLPAKTVVEFLKSTDIETIDTNFDAERTTTPTQQPKTSKPTTSKDDAKIEDAKLIGITIDKEKDFSNWYTQVVVKGELLDYYDVSGCYILRPNSYSVWETIQDWFNIKIKSLGVQNAYFPMFVSQKVLEKEKDHIEGFAPEVAWVTRAGNSELDEHIAIRPTSETVMYPYYAKWIRSHRDLPLKLNQWNSVVRWEFKHPQPFLRTREFLWQEGHTVHLTKEAAAEEVLQILDFYAGVYEELLAVPVVKGKKTENEKFAGGDYTTTVEGFIASTGRGIQGGTSHHLGQNFSKMFNISVENPNGSDERIFAYQNSWGLSTRVIGVMIMTHSDNKGLVLPPRVAQTQVVVIPVGVTAKSTPEQRTQIYKGAEDIESKLKKAGIRAVGDYRDSYNPGWKFADWELKGTPLRLEFGPKDLESKQVTVVRRNDNKKYIVKLDNLETEIPKILEELQNALYEKAKKDFDDHRILVEDWKDFVPTLNKKNVILAPWCGNGDCEDEIKDASSKNDQGEDGDVDEKAPSMGAKSLCIPFEQPDLKEGQKCVRCDNKAVTYCMFGRSY